MSCVAGKKTPMMEQWHQCKKMAKDAVLFFRMGDFYEAFYDDAALISKELGINLTKRQEVPMSGVPYHAAEGYIDKLVAKGYRVAVAEQTEDPKVTKGLVKREVVRVVTPGSVVTSSLLSDNNNNFFASLNQVGSVYGLAYIDLTTAEFRVIECEDTSSLMNELYRLRPSEVLVTEKFNKQFASFFEDLKLNHNFLVTPVDDWRFHHDTTYDFLLNHFQVHSLDGFGMKGHIASVNAAGALLAHLQDTLCLPVQHLREIKTYSTAEFMTLDRITQRNLELTESLQDGSRSHTLLQLMDQTETPMGARLMRNWVKQPLRCTQSIGARQDAVELLTKDSNCLYGMRELLDQIRDLERLTMRISSGYATPRDISSLGASLAPVPKIKSLLSSVSAELIKQWTNELIDLSPLTSLIERALVDEPPLRLSDGHIFREGFHEELDGLRELSQNGKDWLAQYQSNLRDTLGIKTLKVGYNRVFGYYIEVSKGQASRMPPEFTRRQTLANNERFISPVLKEYEEKVLTAEEKMSTLEKTLFSELQEKVREHEKAVLSIARAIAHLDCLQSLSTLAIEQGYQRPLVDQSEVLDIREGRHPVIEASSASDRFIPNDTILNQDDQQLMVITGPNMAGKSTYIRQVALIAIMAQMGSFVPAKEAHIGIIDQVFTRIGASDDLSRGQSTFMVEMTETANILNHATSKSLVILDEIGRGTSTYDGISIAWAVAEYLLTAKGARAKTLFATHYWELTRLETAIPGAVNYTVAVQEHEETIIFLHKIVKGDTDKSYGIHVARLAGLPMPVINRAKAMLADLEANATNRSGAPTARKGTPIKRSSTEVQFLLFEPEGADRASQQMDEMLKALKEVNIDSITPIQALAKLAELQEGIS